MLCIFSDCHQLACIYCTCNIYENSQFVMQVSTMNANCSKDTCRLLQILHVALSVVDGSPCHGDTALAYLQKSRGLVQRRTATPGRLGSHCRQRYVYNW